MIYNFSTKPFTYTWGRIPYTFLPGKEYSGIIISDDGAHSVELNDIVSTFFARHLAEWILNTPEINTNWDKDGNSTKGYPMKYNITTIDMLINRAKSPADVDVQMPSFSGELPIQSRHIGETVEVVISEIKEDSEPTIDPEPEVKKRAPGRPKKEDFNLE